MKRHATVIAVLLLAMLSTVSIHAQQASMPAPLDVPNSIVLPDGFLKDNPGTVMGQWSTAAPIVGGKNYHTVAQANGMLYVFAGINTANQFDVSSYKYDPATDTWSSIADFPLERYLFGRAETVNGKIYIFGGVENFGTSYKAVDAMIEYDPATDTYAQKTPMPDPQGMPGSAVLNDNIYVIAGNGATASVYVTDVQVYDPAADAWFSNTDYPRDVVYLGATTVGDKIVCMGGFNVNYPPSRYIADTYVGELVDGTLEWTKGADAGIGPVIFPAAAGTDDMAYFVGGRPAADGNAPATQRGYSYDPAGDTWAMLEMKPTGVQGVSQAPVIDGDIYFVGGSNPNGVPTDAVEVLSTSKEAGPVAYFPILSLDPWVKTGSASVNAELIVVNWGVDPLTWSATVEGDAGSWTTLGKESGTLQPLVGDTFMVSMATAALTEGEYTGEVVFTTNDPENGTLRVPITLNVQDEDVDTDPFVLVEQYTGTWCPYCPYGVDVLKQVARTYGAKIHRAAWHYNDPMQIEAWPEIDGYIGVSSFPSASINRTQFPGVGGIPISRGSWETGVGTVLNDWRSPVTITLTDKTYDESTKQYSFSADVFFHRGWKGDLRINAMVTENGMTFPNSPQRKYENGQVNQYPNYVHDDVVLGIYPSALGEPLNMSAEHVTQTETTKSFSFTSPHMNSENAQIVVFVHQVNANGTPGPVLQSYQEPLMFGLVLDVEDTPAPGAFALHQNFPNPFNPTTTIAFDVPERSHVRIMLHDALGRTLGAIADESYEAGSHSIVFDAGDLQSGTYYITMHSGDVVETRSMTLVK